MGRGVLGMMVVMSWLIWFSGSERVSVSLYYESLCPYCEYFIVNRFVKVFNDKQLLSIINLNLIPWGNSFLQSDGSFLCQHGPNECFLNAIEACAITIYPDVERHFRFIHCVESKSLEKRVDEWVNCFQIAGIGREPIDCYTSGYGNKIEQQFAAKTAQLNPSHRFVPWIVVDNQPLQEGIPLPGYHRNHGIAMPSFQRDSYFMIPMDFENFVSYICKAYRGSEVPDGCKSREQYQTNYLQNQNPLGVCSPDKIANFTSAQPLKPFINNP